ncbi:hypothetical protein GCM10011591_01780 [Nocardia camponoti]|uniref:Uncharacterized protein n=2 Tax=Nocardia camponoti TaxID=1616106 RepID=A0A917Q780_9NOCA|nr:hypothetical protein GCM10011591_01780 [Nocardia camponoti]
MVLETMVPDTFYVWPDIARDLLSSPRIQELHPGLRARAEAQYLDMLRIRAMTVDDYDSMTEVFFKNEDDLYEFLEQAYHYIFIDHQCDDPPYPEKAW